MYPSLIITVAEYAIAEYVCCAIAEYVIAENVIAEMGSHGVMSVAIKTRVLPLQHWRGPGDLNPHPVLHVILCHRPRLSALSQFLWQR